VRIGQEEIDLAIKAASGGTLIRVDDFLHIVDSGEGRSLDLGSGPVIGGERHEMFGDLRTDSVSEGIQSASRRC